MEYKDLVTVNQQIETIDVKGKMYAPVSERVDAFRMLYPDGTIVTEIVNLENGTCVFKASAYDGEKLLATGHAYELQSASYINKTSFLENCETSAVGRCLGFLGIGISGGIASVEEVKQAQAQQEQMDRMAADEPIDERHFAALKKRFNGAGIKLKDVMEHYGIERPTQITFGLERIINSEFDSLVEALKQ